MTAWCEVPNCHALLVMTEEARRIKRCYAHVGIDFDEETDDQRLERVCKTMGWRRQKAR